MIVNETKKEFSIRIHQDWWGKCRTCISWKNSDNERWSPGNCSNKNSVLFEQETWTEGHCPHWDSFDIETAIELMER